MALSSFCSARVAEEIPESLTGERVDRVVAMFADVSRSLAADAIESGLIILDGQVVSSRSQRVEPGQLIEIDELVGAPPEPLQGDSAVRVNVMYVDDDVIVVNKHNGAVVHPGAGNETGTLVQGLLSDYPEMITVGEPNRPGVVHRLDRGTTGVLVFARSLAGYESLTQQLRARSVHRKYLTLTWGAPEAREGVVDAPMGRAVRDPTRMVVKDGGKPARTLYRAVASWESPEVSLLECELETGRTHQIRVHLEAIGHPVIGDGRYGGGRSGIDFERPALHAGELGFLHPTSGEAMSFVAPLPDDMAALIDGLGPPRWGPVLP